jgi:hypothetical protein
MTKAAKIETTKSKSIASSSDGGLICIIVISHARVWLVGAKAYAAVAVAELFNDYKAIVRPIIDTNGSVLANGSFVMFLAHSPHL